MHIKLIVGATVALLATELPAFAGCPVPTPIATLYVSTAGNDGWSGLYALPQGGSDGPLATLPGARNKLREYRGDGCLTTTQPVRVKVLAGEYFLAAPVGFEIEDSGTAAAPVIYEAFDSSRPLFTGGVRLTGFTQDGPNWRLQRPEFQASHPNHWNFEQLWVNARRATRARSPNRDRLSDADPTRGWHRRKEYAGTLEDRKTYIELEAAQMAELTSLTPQQLLDVQITHMDYWTVSRNYVQSLSGSKVYWAGKTWAPPLPAPEKSRLEFVGLPAALDAPGEFYLDRGTGVLLYRPFPGETIAGSEVIAPATTAPELIHVGPSATSEGGQVEHIRFVGLGFRYSPYLLRRTWVDGDKFTGGYNDSYGGFSLPAAVTIRDGYKIVLDNVEIAHTGAAAVWVRGTSSSQVEVKNSRLFDLGGGGVKIAEYEPSLAYQINHSNVGSTIPMGGGHRVENNVIHSGGRSFYDTPGILVASSAQNTIQHNDVADFYNSGISLNTFRRCNDAELGPPYQYPGDFASFDNVVQYNRVHQIGQEMLSDLGGIYFFGRNTNSVAAFNEVSNVRHWGHRPRPLIHSGAGYLGVGLYADSGSHGVSFLKNVAFDLETGGLWMNHGQNRVVRNNVFAFSEEFAAGPGFERCLNDSRTAPTVIADKNVLFFDDYVDQGYALWTGGSPSTGQQDRNLYFQLGGGSPEVHFNGGVIPFSTWQGYADFNSIVADPLFVDPYNWNFQLQAGSPALQPPISHVPINPPEAIGVLPSSPASPVAGRLWAPGADFGGMFGFTATGHYGNPYYIANGQRLPSCPPGYTETRILGTANLDYFASYCHRPRDDQKPLADFGGMFGWSGGQQVTNPLTNTFGCPAGYTQEQVLGGALPGQTLDDPLFYCHRAYSPLQPPRTWGGIYGYYWEDLALQHQPNPNPFTRRRPVCPAGFVGTTVYGTAGRDYPVVVCFAP